MQNTKQNLFIRCRNCGDQCNQHSAEKNADSVFCCVTAQSGTAAGQKNKTAAYDLLPDKCIAGMHKGAILAKDIHPVI